MRILACQLDCAWQDRDANFERVRLMLADAAPEPGSLVVLPEMFASGFSMDVAAVADTSARETEAFLSALAVAHGVHVVAGVVARGADGRGRNRAVAVSAAGRVVARYDKLHPFGPGGEARHYRAGRRTVVFRVGDLPVAPFICYDLRFPEIFRVAALAGARLFVVIASWPAARREHWDVLLRARAIENQAFVVGVNRCGADPHHAYAGGSIVVAPAGEVLACAQEGETLVAAEIDVAAADAYRERFPVLRDARREFLRPGTVRGPGRDRESRRTVA